MVLGDGNEGFGSYLADLSSIGKGKHVSVDLEKIMSTVLYGTEKTFPRRSSMLTATRDFANKPEVPCKTKLRAWVPEA